MFSSFAGPPDSCTCLISTLLWSLTALSHSLAFVGPIIAAVSKLLCGCLSDLSLGKQPEVSYLIFTVCLFRANKHEILLGTTIVIYIAMGVTFVLIPSIISDQFEFTLPNYLVSPHLGKNFVSPPFSNSMSAGKSIQLGFYSLHNLA